jgi:hypothetical protein
MLEDSLQDNKLFILNYIKSLCEVASLINSNLDFYLFDNKPSLNSAVIANLDKVRLREMSVKQFKSEVKATVRYINDVIALNLREIKVISLAKIEGLVHLIKKVAAGQSEWS